MKGSPMGSKRVSVPDFEEIIITKQINTEPSRISEVENVTPQPKPPQAISDIISTMFKSDKKEPKEETPATAQELEKDPIVEEKIVMPAKANSIIENLKQIETMRKISEEQNKPIASFDITPEKQGKETVKTTIEAPKNAEPSTPEYPKLAEPLTEEQSMKMVKSLNLWSKEVELNLEQFPEYPQYFYISRKNSMNKIGNSYIVDKTTAKIYSVPASMPEYLSFKKIKNNNIQPLG